MHGFTTYSIDRCTCGVLTNFIDARIRSGRRIRMTRQRRQNLPSFRPQTYRDRRRSISESRAEQGSYTLLCPTPVWVPFKVSTGKRIVWRRLVHHPSAKLKNRAPFKMAILLQSLFKSSQQRASICRIQFFEMRSGRRKFDGIGLGYASKNATQTLGG